MEWMKHERIEFFWLFYLSFYLSICLSLYAVCLYNDPLRRLRTRNEVLVEERADVYSGGRLPRVDER